jgi:histidinol-phosphate aminotransferase
MKPAQRFNDLPPYTPIEPFDVLSKRLGKPIEEITKLDANENPYGPSPRVREALARMEFANIYPDPENRALRSKLAEFTGVPMDYLFPGSGADELLDLLLRVMIEPGDKVINLPPTFGMYSFDTHLNNGQVIDVVRKPDMSIDIEAVEAAVEQYHPKIIFVTSPNNPDGGLLGDAEMERLLNLPVLIVLDEAYIEFSRAGGRLGERLSRIREVPNRDNLVVLRTFSKWAGLAGLRVGYGAFPAWIMPIFWKAKQPYNVNVAASTAAITSLEDVDVLAERVAWICEERERLFWGLQSVPFLRPYPSQANFILCNILHEDNEKTDLISGKILKQELAAKGVFIRYYDTPLLKDMIRISVGRPEDTSAFFRALAEIAAAHDLPTAWIEQIKLDNQTKVSRQILKIETNDEADSGYKFRVANISRLTSETNISIKLNLDGTGAHDIQTGVGFLDHMLTQIAVHGLFDLEIKAKGDLEIDSHHTVEDVALSLGQAFSDALGSKKGIVRMASADCPMDESLAHVVIDFSGRPYCVLQTQWTSPAVGSMPTTMVDHFLESFAIAARCNLHAKVEYGRDDHHKAEAIFKALGRCLCAATRIDPRRLGTVASSKGILF